MSRLLPASPERRALLSLLLVAAALRLVSLGSMPPGLQFDEAHNAIDAARVLNGQGDWFFTDNGGREPLATYLHAPALALVGRDKPTLALRLISALAGLATIIALYRCVRDIFEDRRLALLAAGFLAFSFWHLHFSRYGIRAILAPLWTTLAIWSWWRSTTGSPSPASASLDEPNTLPRERGLGGEGHALAWPLLCGLFLAAAVYSHPSGRLLPVVLIGHALYRSLAKPRDRTEIRRSWRSLTVAGLASFVLFIPLGLWFLTYPEWFTSHPGDVSILAVAEKQYDGSVAHALWANALAIAGMFFVSGDPSTFHNLPYLPAWDPLTALLGIIGFGIALGALSGGDRSQRDRAVLCALWFAVLLLPTWLSDRPPNFSRAIAALPVIALMPALGLRWGVAALDLRWRGRDGERLGLGERTRMALLITPLALAALWTGWQYFVVFGQRTPHVYYSYDVEKQEAFDWLVEQAKDAEVFLHPLWSGHATIEYLEQQRRESLIDAPIDIRGDHPGPIQSLDALNTLVLPEGGFRDVLIAFPAKEFEREGWQESIDRFLPDGLAEPQAWIDDQGNPQLTTFRISSADLVERWYNRGDWSEAPAFSEPDGSGSLVFHNAAIGPSGAATSAAMSTNGEYQVLPPDSIRAGRPLDITLRWRCRGQIDRDWTLFVHLLADDGSSWGQMDRQPADGSFPTSNCRDGDMLIDRYAPELAVDAVGNLTIRIGWYDASSGERLPVWRFMGPSEVETELVLGSFPIETAE